MKKIYPDVKKLNQKEGKLLIGDRLLSIFLLKEKENAFSNRFVGFKFVDQYDKALIKTKKDNTFNIEEYEIDVCEDEVLITYNEDVGLYYSLLTLEQIIEDEYIPCIHIHDVPDLSIRGFMLDISRDKIPKINTIKNIIDLMSSLKMNHLELYVEGFSFEYASFKQYLEEDGYISIKEYQELEKYANDRFIDLVPNQNGFGHMTKWLEKEELKDLAECPDGMYMWGTKRKSSTLNPLDDRSIQLVEKMYNDMLKHTNSKYFNMNFDEPFELGNGRSKEVCNEYGEGNVYIDYTLKAYEIIKKYNKTPMIWGDVLIRHPDLLHRLPKDMIFLDWGYDGTYKFDYHAKELKKQGVKFVCAPGTTSWCSFTGRTYDWIENITNAVNAAKNNDGLGVILTDWGDFGHLQFWPFSIAPLVYMGLLSYRASEGMILQIKHYLNKKVFFDNNNIIADCLMDLGEYNRYEEVYGGNGTLTFYTFMWAVHAVNEEDPIAYFKGKNKYNFLSSQKFKILRKFLNLKIEELEMSNCSKLVKDEINQTIRTLKSIHKLSIAFNEDFDLQKRIRYLEEVVASKEALIEEQSRLWLERNKSGGLVSSLSYLERFIGLCKITLDYLIKRGEGYEEEVEV